MLLMSLVDKIKNADPSKIKYLGGFIRYIQSYVNEYDHKIPVFIFFLALATTFWLLNSFNKQYTTSIVIPVQYINPPQDKVLTQDLPEEFLIKVEAQGFDLLDYKMSFSRKTVKFDVSSYSVLAGNNNSNFNVPTRTNITKLQEQLDDMEILSISPDTLRFEFAPLHTKRIPVVPNVNVIYERQYLAKGEIITEPDSIFISGPDYIIDTIEHVRTISEKLVGVDRKIEMDLPLARIENVSFSNQAVKVIINTEKFTEKTLKIPIIIENQPDSLSVKTFPSRIKVKFHVGISNYDRVVSEQFRAVVDYTETEEKPGKLDVKLNRIPGIIQSVTYSPDRVDYIIEKR
jgi:YbbR domain-containing protein